MKYAIAKAGAVAVLGIFLAAAGWAQRCSLAEPAKAGPAAERRPRR